MDKVILTVAARYKAHNAKAIGPGSNVAKVFHRLLKRPIRVEERLLAGN
jgi:hypothetical protein